MQIKIFALVRIYTSINIFIFYAVKTIGFILFVLKNKNLSNIIDISISFMHTIEFILLLTYFP